MINLSKKKVITRERKRPPIILRKPIDSMKLESYIKSNLQNNGNKVDLLLAGWDENMQVKGIHYSVV